MIPRLHDLTFQRNTQIYINFRLHVLVTHCTSSHRVLSKTVFGRGRSTVAKNEMWVSQVCFAYVTWLYGLFVRTFISLTNAYATCGRPTLNFIERFWLGSVSRQRSHFTSCQSGAVAYVQIMPNYLAWLWTQKLFCMRSLSLYYCMWSQVKRQKIWLLSQPKSHSGEGFSRHHYLFSGRHEDQSLSRTNEWHYM